jgi:hypothetical protein
VNDHTFVYQYPPDEVEDAMALIKRHVEEGLLHPYAGLLLVHIGRSNEL